MKTTTFAMSKGQEDIEMLTGMIHSIQHIKEVRSEE